MRGSKINYENLVAAVNDYAKFYDPYDYRDVYDTDEDGYNDFYNNLNDPLYRKQIMDTIRERIEESKDNGNFMLKESKNVLKMIQNYHNANNNPLKKANLSYKMPKQARLNKMSKGY